MIGKRSIEKLIQAGSKDLKTLSRLGISELRGLGLSDIQARTVSTFGHRVSREGNSAQSIGRVAGTRGGSLTIERNYYTVKPLNAARRLNILRRSMYAT
jgi:hypothetical protein